MKKRSTAAKRHKEEGEEKSEIMAQNAECDTRPRIHIERERKFQKAYHEGQAKEKDRGREREGLASLAGPRRVSCSPADRKYQGRVRECDANLNADARSSCPVLERSI